MKTHTKFECELCGACYDTAEEAQSCESIPMAPADAEPGEIVTLRGQGYGWWSDDREWFHDDPGDPNSKSHLERGTIGYPKYVVIDVVEVRNIPGRRGWGGRYDHSYGLLLYSPRWANGPPVIYCWTCPGTHHSVRDHLGRVSDEDLERYRAEIKAADLPLSLS